MPATYEKIATTTLSSASSTIDFTSIGSGYTDLRLILTYRSSSGFPLTRLRYNSDSGTNYSVTNFGGDGTSVFNNRTTSQAQISTDTYAGDVTNPTLLIIDIFSYAGSTYKTCLINANEDRNGAGQVTRGVGLWRSTSAITAINLFTTSASYAIGTTATLYGILKA